MAHRLFARRSAMKLCRIFAVELGVVSQPFRRHQFDSLTTANHVSPILPFCQPVSVTLPLMRRWPLPNVQRALGDGPTQSTTDDVDKEGRVEKRVPSAGATFAVQILARLHHHLTVVFQEQRKTGEIPGQRRVMMLFVSRPDVVAWLTPSASAVAEQRSAAPAGSRPAGPACPALALGSPGRSCKAATYPMRDSAAS
jgi:hypothetical protein